MDMGVVIRGLGFGLLALMALACGASDDPTPNCGTAQSPMALEVKDVSPAVDASVANSAIVQTFTLVGQHLQLDTHFAKAADTHTAGETTPKPLSWTLSASGADTVYTSVPFSWQNAPAHVELDTNSLMTTTDGCVFALPKQLFKYDVTAP
jgi:hypothetical protein